MHDEKKNQTYLEKYLEERKKQPSRLLRNVIILAVIVIFKICFLMSFQLYIMYLYCYFKQKEMNKNFKSFSRVSSIRNGKKNALEWHTRPSFSLQALLQPWPLIFLFLPQKLCSFSVKQTLSQTFKPLLCMYYSFCGEILLPTPCLSQAFQSPSKNLLKCPPCPSSKESSSTCYHNTPQRVPYFFFYISQEGLGYMW